MQKQLSNRINDMAESATLKMAALGRELKAQGKDVISLSLGEPDFDTPDNIKEAAKIALDEGYTKYTPVPGLLEVREAISEKFKRENQLDYNANQIVISNGAKQAIANLSLSLLNPGDEAIIFAPYWVSYFEIIRLSGATPVIVSADIDQDYKVTPDQLKAAITDKTKIVLFSSPCNPTGSVYSLEELKALAAVIESNDKIVIISDEIYEYINFGDQHASIGAINSVKDRVVTINGFSKGYAMTGWRLGYMGAPEWIAKGCIKMQGQFTSGANSFGQKACIEAIKGDQTPRLEMKAAFEKRRNLVVSALKEIPGFKVNMPTGAFYIFPDISYYFGKSDGNVTIHNSDDFANYLLSSVYVAVVSGSAFGADKCMRISYAASEAELLEAIRRIKEAVTKLI